MVDVEYRTSDERRVRPLEGRETIRNEATAWLGRTPAFSYEILDVVANRRSAAVRWRYVVDGLELEGVSWLDCADGRISRAYVYFDSHALLTAPRSHASNLGM
jgi:hypothetical protein